MEETSSKTKKYLYIALALMVIVVACMVMFLSVPMVKKVYGTKDGFEEKKLKFEAIRKDAAESGSFTDLVEGLGDGQQLVEQALIKESTIVEFIEEIESISSSVGNEIEISHKKAEVKRAATSSILPSDPEAEKARKEEEEKKKNTVILEVNVFGSYKQFLEFFYKLENMTYIFNVDSFVVDKSTSSRGLLEEQEMKDLTTGGKITISFIPKKDN